MNILRKLTKQFFGFLLISGIGWLIDFGVYYILSGFMNLSVITSNLISTVPAFTFVFLVSTRKIFHKKPGRVSLSAKFSIYFTYQIIMVFAVSALGQKLFELFSGFNLLSDIAMLKLAAKVAITPITICLNFIMLKLLTEKI